MPRREKKQYRSTPSHGYEDSHKRACLPSWANGLFTAFSGVPSSFSLCRLPGLPGHNLLGKDYRSLLGFLAPPPSFSDPLWSRFLWWACPGGLVNQLIGKLSITKLRVRKWFTKIAPLGLLVGLAIALLLWFGLHNPRSMIPIRIGEFWKAVWLSFEHASPLWLARTFVVLGLAAAGFVLANLWCRFACPAGWFSGAHQAHFPVQNL